MKISPTAIVSPDAELAEGVEIGHYSIIGADVKIGKNTVIGPHTVIDNHTHIGENCHIFHFCSIGAPPQDLKFIGEKTRVIIGDSKDGKGEAPKARFLMKSIFSRNAPANPLKLNSNKSSRSP